MLVLLVLLLVLIPAAAILYPFFRGPAAISIAQDEASEYSEQRRRWEGAVSGLRNTELERAIGNLSEEDYQWLKEHYMTQAALTMKAMELEDQQEEEMLSSIAREVREVRQRFLADESAGSGGETAN